jgi:hypothetical protein
MVCSGASSKMNSPSGMSAPSGANWYTPPFAELNVSRSLNTRAMSS